MTKRQPERSDGPYGWVPTLIGLMALGTLAIGFCGLSTLRDRLIASTGRTLALTAAESVDKLDLILAEHVRDLRILGNEVDHRFDDVTALQERLLTFAADHPEFRWIGVTDLSAQLIAATSPAPADSTVVTTPWFAVARDVGLDVRALRPAEVLTRRAPILAFTVPLSDASGTTRGALIAHTGLSRARLAFDRSARTLRRKWGGAVRVDWHLLSPNGELIASTNRRPILGKLALPSAFASAAAAPGYLEERDPARGIAMLTGYARMRGRGLPIPPRWALLIHVDQRDIVGPINTTILKLAALWVIVISPLFLLAIWATRHLRRGWLESRAESRRAAAAHAAANDSEARMRAVLDHAAEGIVTVDAGGVIESFNAAAMRMFEWTSEELRGQNVAVLLPSGAGGRHDGTVARWLERTALRSLDRTLEINGRRRNGTVFPVGLALSQVTSGDHRVFVGIIRDLTEQKRAAYDRGILASIIEHSDDFVGFASTEGQILFVNPAGRRLAGLDPVGPIQTLSIDDFVLPDDRGYFHQEIIPTVLRAGRWQGELRGRHLRTQEALPVAVNLFLVHHPQSGQPSGLAAVCRDLREQKRVEAETSQARELTLAKEMAEAASLAKSEFLATMSHEIRTPLNGVVGMTALLLDTKLNEEQREYAESLHTCSESLLSVINDVLDFSKMEAGKLDLEVIDFDLRRTVEEVVELFAERAHSKGLELAALIEPGTPTALRGDPNRLRQILTNLLSNALKFTERGEVVVQASAAGDAPTHTLLRLEVTDTGIGIAPERQAMIFESFSQSDVSNARLYGGSGLGLAIVKRLSELMSGQIVVDSERGAGSTFSLVLRLEKQSPAPTVASIPFMRGRRVLVVDDSPTVRTHLRSYLRSFGIRCGSTEDGAHALALLRGAAARRKPYDLVLLDLEMPIMDGIEVARAIRAEPQIAAAKIVLLTAIGQRTAARRSGRRAGIDAYLAKPVRVGRLETCLASVLGVPAARTARPDDASRPRQQPPRPAQSGFFILVAEDDPISQKVIVRMLTKRGHRVDVAGDGRLAVDACIRRAYDLVLMDCRLPDLDGFAATREIRRREPAGRCTPVVALTANTAPEIRERCLEAGMVDHVRKPVRSDELDALLRRWLPSDRQRPSAPATVATVLDAAGLLERIEGDRGFLRELTVGLQRDTPTWLHNLRAAIDGGDTGALEHVAHSIRGSVSNLGGGSASALAESLETKAHAGELRGASQLCSALEHELTRLHQALLALGGEPVSMRGSGVG